MFEFHEFDVRLVVSICYFVRVACFWFHNISGLRHSLLCVELLYELHKCSCACVCFAKVTDAEG